MLLELQGSSEMKAGVSGVCERVSPDPDRAFKHFHPIQFIIHTICVLVRNHLWCYKPEYPGPVCSLCTQLGAIQPKSKVFLPLPLALFFSPAIFRDSWKMDKKKKEKSLFLVFNA